MTIMDQADHARTTRCRRLLSGAFAALVLTATAAAPVRADPITFYFSGTVDSVYEPDDVINSSVAPGVAFHGHYTFDPDATDGNGDPDIGWYESQGAQYEYVVHVGDYTFTSVADNFQSIDINVYNDGGGWDTYSVHAAFVVTASPSLHDDVVAIESHFSLSDADQTAFDSGNLPLTPPSLAPFSGSPGDINDFIIHGLPTGGGSPLLQVRGTVTSLVPEPGSLALLGLTGAAMLGRRRHPRAPRPRNSREPR